MYIVTLSERLQRPRREKTFARLQRAGGPARLTCAVSQSAPFVHSMPVRHADSALWPEGLDTTQWDWEGNSPRRVRNGPETGARGRVRARAAEGDPIGGYHVTPAGYYHMTERLLELAGGRLVLALEGFVCRRRTILIGSHRATEFQAGWSYIGDATVMP